MQHRSGFLAVVVAGGVLLSSVAGAGENARGKPRRADPGHSPQASGAASGQAAKFYGVPLSPPVYFINFLMLYIANPNEAAFMPAYRTPLPTELSDCLQANPKGCPYASHADSFDERTAGDSACDWPPECQTSPKWESLGPGNARRPSQINEPLGLERANRLAAALGIDKSMILTDEEYRCTIGVPPRDDDRKIISQCVANLTNSNGRTNIPLSSYGLAITTGHGGDVPAGDVQALCAPDAPCLVFNELFLGALERIAAVCGWEGKFVRLLAETPFQEFAKDGKACQEFGGSTSGGPCIVERICGGS